jgi:hypothetical protein
MFKEFTKDEIYEHTAGALILLKGGEPEAHRVIADELKVAQAQVEASIALTMALTNFMVALDESRCGHGTPELLHPCPDCTIVRL